MHWTTDRPLTHPAAKKLVSELVKGFTGQVLIRKRRPIVFVCGGAIGSSIYLRDGFLSWAAATIPGDAKFLLSEDAYASALKIGTKFINLSEFEQVIAALSDCVLIFPESPGSFAETGIFATAQEIRNKTLVANDLVHLHKDSFLLLGPFHTIEQTSVFTPSVTFDSSLESDATLWPRIWRRIGDRYKPQIKPRRLDAHPFYKLALRQRMALIFTLIRVAGIAKFADLLDIIRSIYPKHDDDPKLLKESLSVLLALNQIEQPVEELYFANVDSDFDLDVKQHTSRLSARFRLFWINEFPELWEYTV